MTIHPMQPPCNRPAGLNAQALGNFRGGGLTLPLTRGIAGDGRLLGRLSSRYDIHLLIPSHLSNFAFCAANSSSVSIPESRNAASLVSSSAVLGAETTGSASSRHGTPFSPRNDWILPDRKSTRL